MGRILINISHGYVAKVVGTFLAATGMNGVTLMLLVANLANIK